MFRFFENLVDPYQPYDDEDTPPNRVAPFLWNYLKPFKSVIIWITLATIVVGLLEIFLIYYAGRVVDLMEASTPATVLKDHGWELFAVAIFILTLRPILSIIDAMLLNQSLLPNVGTIVRWRSHRHVLRQSVGWFQNDFAGRLANRVMQTAPATGEAVYQIFDAMVYALIYLIGAVVLLAGSDPRLIIPFMIWMVAYYFLTRTLIPRIAVASKDFSDARSLITGRIVDSYSNIQSVKLFAHTQGEEEFAREAIEKSRQMFMRETRLITWMEIGLLVINGFLIVAVIGWSIALWINGSATLGTIAAASALTLRLNAMTGWIMWALSSFFTNIGVVMEGMETIAQPLALVDQKDAQDLDFKGGKIEFDAATHRYGKSTGGMDNVTLTIQPGERIGIVGRSGAGKSTLVNLLMRFHDLEGGEIRVDGQSIASITQDSLRRNVGMVTQDSSLMHRSVRDNIAYGRPDASDAEIAAAAKQAEASAFIPDLEDPEGRSGLDAHVGERGVKLSGGQRQRIALARVILKNAPILVLDEATSALDSEVEAAIQDTLYGVMEGKTVIAIAHRLSTIAHLDRIVVLDDGRIVEDGTHSELLAQNGLYASFWNRQSGGFLGVEAAE